MMSLQPEKRHLLSRKKLYLLNNDLFDLGQDEKKEIYRIISTLCDEIRFYLRTIINSTIIHFAN